MRYFPALTRIVINGSSLKRVQIMVRSVFRTAAVSCAFFSFLFAQGIAHAQQNPVADRDSQIEKLVSDWNSFRNSADTEALTQVFHPEDRGTAADFYANQRPATVKARVLGIQPAPGGRVNIRVERSWGGSRPGKTVDTLQASAVDGQWFLRIPGGTLKAAVKPAPQAAKAPVPTVQAPPPVAATVAPPASQAAVPAVAQAAKPAPAEAPPVQAAAAQPQAPAPAPAANPVTRRFDNWTRVCETAKVSAATCFLQASLTNSSDKQPIMLWRVQVLEDKGTASIILIPSGVTIPAGLTLSLSKEQPTKVPFRVCNAQNCEVRFRMEPALVETVGKRAGVPVKFINQANAQVEFNVPMKGFREGVSSILSGKN